jgi:hexosaminidase
MRPFIHIGGDEVSLVSGNWNKHVLDQAITNSLGLTNTPGGSSAMQKYQSWFTQKIADFINSRGWTMMGWSEIMNGGTVTNAGLMDWIDGSGSRATQAATNGEPVVMTSSAELYLNKWQTGTSSSGGGVVWSNEPPGQSGLVTMSTVYNFEPVNSFLLADTNGYATNIIGIQGNTWGEYIPSLKNMEFRTYPRLCAVAESGWTPRTLKSLSNFNTRLAVHKLRLTQMGVNYNPEATPPAAGSWSSGQISTNYTQLVWDISNKISSAGEIDLSFCWKSGANGLKIQWAALEENGVELDRDTHDGLAQSGTQSRVQYALRLRSLRPGATYTIRASVAGNGGTTSSGIVYLPLWD